MPNAAPAEARTRAVPGAPRAVPPPPPAARIALLAGALLGGSGVAAGAFAAHALKSRLDPAALAVFETAARYQLIHALALLAAAWVNVQWPSRGARAAVAFLVVGVVLFSGSLYALALTDLRPLGAVTPFGGLAFLAGWLCLAWVAWRGPSAP